jgi:MYXO-CTERM domain-containing protein
MRLMQACLRASTRLALAGLFISGHAWSAPCGIPDVDATYPRANALRVPANAVLSAHYGAPAEYDGEPVTLTASNGANVPLNVSYAEAEGMLSAVPQSPLVAGSYTLVWPSLRGPGTGSGRSKTIDFSVMALSDQVPPTFAGLADVTWDLAREKDQCTDALEDRFVFDFELGSAEDDADPGHLAVLVFETEHPRSGPSTPPRQIGIYPLPANGKLRVQRPARRAGKSCFAAVTRDLAGFVSAGGNEEVCAETIEPPWFEGCSVVAGAGKHPASGLFALLGLGWLVQRRRGFREQSRATS